MDAGPARRRSAGFSLVELLLTLLALGLVAWLVLRIVDRGTRIRGEDESAAGPEGVLKTAFRLLGKDVRAAAAGGLPLADAVRLVADQTGAAGPAAYPTAGGAPVAVRTGTDQIGLRGAVRTPLLALDARVPGAEERVVDRLHARPSEVPLRALRAASLASVRARLAASPGAPPTFFFVRDAAGRWAVGRVTSTGGGAGSAPLDLVVDFTDPDARARNRGADADAASRLEDAATGGLFDDLVWFVARGLEGRPPDFILGSDPESMRFPHPFLAVASRLPGDRWEIRGAGEEIEDMQIAWGVADGSGELGWRGGAPGVSATSPSDLVDASGASRLRALRVALVARAPERLARSSGSPAPEFAVPLNAPAPGSVPGAAPIGWDPRPERRVRFDRETREERVDLVPAAAAR
jgi:type II secretory pathway pseudopilin PulG